MERQEEKYLGKKLEGRYEIKKLVGMGGMANVYKAFDTIDGREVSVKILRDEYLGNTEFLRRFKNESKAIAVLNHPNIVRVYDVSFAGQVQSIVMEYIDGITLKDYIEHKGVLEPKEALNFTLQILKALAHAHEKGIVHRDIKPHNIMLTKDGAIKVTDFGIARFARSEVRTITDRAIGSVHYISPEQAMGENTDQKTDIYSVGVMLYEMLTGRVPFESDSAVSVAIKHVQSRAALPTALNPGLPRGLEEITLRAMEKSSAARYQSAAEMIVDIEKFKADPSVSFRYKSSGSHQGRTSAKKLGRPKHKTREEGPLNSKKRTKKGVPYLPILAGVTFAFVLASLGFIGLMIHISNPFAQVEEVQVPNLVGLRLDTASGQFSGMGIQIVQEASVYNSDFAPGVIFAQEPRAGRTIREGNAVRVRVSSGQQLIPLENFAGRSLAQTRSWMEERHLSYEVIHANSGTVPEGHVIFTNPSVGYEVRTGETVAIHVSLGPDIVWRSVPDIRGMSIEQAQQMLEFSNLRLGDVVFQDSAESPPNTVLAQEPMDGTMQAEGTAINLVVSRAVELRRVAIPVDLPETMNEFVTIQALQDGVLVQEDVLNPAAVGVWRPIFEGADAVVAVEIRINGNMYRQYNLDFSSNPPTFQQTAGAEPALPPAPPPFVEPGGDTPQFDNAGDDNFTGGVSFS